MELPAFAVVPVSAGQVASMVESVRRLAFTRDGVPPCGRVLVRTGRVAVIECTRDELASVPDGALVWSPTEPVPVGVPALESDERDFVAAGAVSVIPGDRLLDGEDWDSPGAQPPDAPR